MKKANYSLAIVNSLVVLAAAMIASRYIHQAPVVFKFFAGIFLGTYAAAASDLFDHLVNNAKNKSFKQVVLSDTILGSVVKASVIFWYLILGGIIWFAGWEGSTGYCYGLGVLIGVKFFHYGIGSVVNNIFFKKPEVVA